MAAMTLYESIKKADASLYPTPETVSELLPIVSLSEEGIMELPGNRFSKCYELTDMHFSALSDDDQDDLISAYKKVLDTFSTRVQLLAGYFPSENEGFPPTNVHENIQHTSTKIGNEETAESLKKSLETEISYKTRNARRGLEYCILLVLTIKAGHMREAVRDFAALESSITNSFYVFSEKRLLGPAIRPLSINEWVDNIRSITGIGITRKATFDINTAFHSLRDPISELSPIHFEERTDCFKINGHFGTVFYADEIAEKIESDIVDALTGIGCICLFSLSSERVENAVLKKELRRKLGVLGVTIERQRARNRRKGDLSAPADSLAIKKKDLLEKLRDEVAAGENHYFSTTITILVMASTISDLDRAKEKLMSMSGLKSIELFPCLMTQKQALCSTLPFGAKEFKRPHLFSARTLAQFIPYRSEELFEKNGIFYGTNQISMNPIYGDKKQRKSHNALILGQTGSGKSGFSKLEMIQTYFKYESDHILIIDPMGEYKKIALPLGGEVISLGGENIRYINPMEVDFTGKTYGEVKEIIADKTDFVITLLLACTKIDFSAEEKGIISRAVDKVYSEYYEMCRSESGAADVSMSFSPMLQDVYQCLLDEGTRESISIANSMDIFVNGALDLFNHRGSADLSARMLVFDLSELKENLRLPAMLVVMEIVRSRIKQGFADGSWTHLYIDEFHELLGIPAVADFVKKLWKEVRKMRGVVTGITQNMSDLLQNDAAGNLSSILSNTEIFAIMAQSSTDKRAIMDFLPQVPRGMFSRIEGARRGCGLLIMGQTAVPFDLVLRSEAEVTKFV